jgi:hypothetical protein
MMFEQTPARLLQSQLTSPQMQSPSLGTFHEHEMQQQQQQLGTNVEVLFDSSPAPFTTSGGTFLDPLWQGGYAPAPAQRRPTEASAVPPPTSSLPHAGPSTAIFPPQPAATIGDLGELYRQRDVLQQAMLGMRRAQAELSSREEKLAEREKAVTAREQALLQLEEAVRRREERSSEAEKQLAASERGGRLLAPPNSMDEQAAPRAALPAVQMLFEKEEKLALTMQTVEEYRASLRRAHKELNAREIDLDALKAALHQQRDQLAAREAALASRETLICDEQDAVLCDVRRHADRLSASSKEVERRVRDVAAREEAACSKEYEVELRQIEAGKYEASLRRCEEDLDRRALEIHRCVDESMKLEYHARVLEREMARLHEREQELWSKAAACVPAAPPTLAAVSKALFGLRGELNGMAAKVPPEKALFHTVGRR